VTGAWRTHDSHDDNPVTVVRCRRIGLCAPEAIVTQRSTSGGRSTDSRYATRAPTECSSGRTSGFTAPSRGPAGSRARCGDERAKAFPQRYTENGRVLALPVRTLREATTECRAALRMLCWQPSAAVAGRLHQHQFIFRAWRRTRQGNVRRALGARTRSLAAAALPKAVPCFLPGRRVRCLARYAGVRVSQLVLMDFRGDNHRVDARVLLLPRDSACSRRSCLG
jgi:hypothetical protein